jgi:hypothetical protein
MLEILPSSECDFGSVARSIEATPRTSGMRPASMSRSSEDQIKRIYFSLRVGVAVTSSLLPPLLWVGRNIAGFLLLAWMNAYDFESRESPLQPVGPCASPDAAGAATANPATLPTCTIHKNRLLLSFPHSQRKLLTFRVEFARFVFSNFPFISLAGLFSFHHAVESVPIRIQSPQLIPYGGSWMTGRLSLGGIGWARCDMR